MGKSPLFICWNGRFIKQDEMRFGAENRAFKYGDGFFETMHYAFGEVQLFDLHLKRMKKAMQLLKIESDILTNTLLLHKEIVHLNNANHFFKGARIRITIYRSGGGLYAPESSKAEYLIESTPLKNDDYPLNTKGLSVAVYSAMKKPTDAFNFYKSMNSRVSILASIYKKEVESDDCFLVNNDLDIIESISSNTFFIRDKTIYTAGNDSGCIHGVMREKLLQEVQKLGLNLVMDSHIKAHHLLQFDEMFLTNAIKGIQWIGAYKTKRYDNKICKEIHKALVQSIFNP